MFTSPEIQNLIHHNILDQHIKDVENMCDLLENTKNLDRRVRVHVLNAQIRIFAYVCIHDTSRDIISSLLINVGKNKNWDAIGEDERAKVIKRCFDTFEEEEIIDDIFIMYI